MSQSNFPLVHSVAVIVLLLFGGGISYRSPDSTLAIPEIDPTSFADTLRFSPVHLLVEFYSPRCPWSEAFQREMELLSKLLSREHRVIRLYKMDITKPIAHSIKLSHEIRGTPTLVFYKRGLTQTPIHLDGLPLWKNFEITSITTRLQRILTFINQNARTAILLTDLTEIPGGPDSPLPVYFGPEQSVKYPPLRSIPPTDPFFTDFDSLSNSVDLSLNSPLPQTTDPPKIMTSHASPPLTAGTSEFVLDLPLGQQVQEPFSSVVDRASGDKSNERKKAVEDPFNTLFKRFKEL